MDFGNDKGAGSYHALDHSDRQHCGDASGDGHSEFEALPQHRNKSTWLRGNFLKIAQFIVLVDIAILLTIDVTATLVARVRRSKTCNHHQEPQKMADFLDYKIQFKDRPEWSMGHYGSGFNAPPSDELDDLWEDLLEAKNIRISPEEVRSLDTNLTHKVRVNDGDYVGVIGAYHQLHCLNIIRRLIHWDYYGPRMSEEERESFLWKQHHSDHCLEVFRQSIMCHAYPSFYLGEWVADSHEFPNIELMAQGSTKCVDWDRLDTWARKRKLVQGHFKTKPGPYEKSASKHQKHG